MSAHSKGSLPDRWLRKGQTGPRSLVQDPRDFAVIGQLDVAIKTQLKAPKALGPFFAIPCVFCHESTDFLFYFILLSNNYDSGRQEMPKVSNI